MRASIARAGLALAVLALQLALVISPARAAAPIYGFQVVHAYPHDPQAFTEGLFYKDGFLFESTGLEGHSTIRKEAMRTGKVLLERAIAPEYFGEGIVAWKGRLIELTWRSQTGFIYDLATFKPLGKFSYSGEGWALTKDASRLIMSDGTPQIRFLDPATLRETGRLTVTADGVPLRNINELEWVKGEIFANVWQTSVIARIDPKTGNVVGWIDLRRLAAMAGVQDPDAVLNGVAYDAGHDRLFVTGKLWPKLYEIKLTGPTAR
jgi:glutaminyl-peptide cyclotransferase